MVWDKFNVSLEFYILGELPIYNILYRSFGCLIYWWFDKWRRSVGQSSKETDKTHIFLFILYDNRIFALLLCPFVHPWFCYASLLMDVVILVNIIFCPLFKYSVTGWTLDWKLDWSQSIHWILIELYTSAVSILSANNCNLHEV